MIKLLLCDGDGTLVLNDPSTANQIITGLQSNGIEIGVVTNRKSDVIKNFKDAGIALPPIIIEPQDTPSNKRKPSAELVHIAQKRADIAINEVALLGDNIGTDILCAVNAKIMPLLAIYSDDCVEHTYGLGMLTPQYLLDYSRIYLCQNTPYFGWQYSGHCKDTGSDIDVRTLLYDHAWSGDIIKNLLKGNSFEQANITLGSRGIKVASLLFHHLATKIFMSGLASEIDIITLYPSHREDTLNYCLKQYMVEFETVFKSKHNNRYNPNLLIRHKTAPQSRLQRGDRNIYDQFRTIMVNPDSRKHIEGRHILVLDDYTTRGFSLETARRMLLKAGARKVTGLAIGKWRNEQTVTQIDKDWNPYEPCSLTEMDIKLSTETGKSFSQADDYFRDVVWEWAKQ